MAHDSMLAQAHALLDKVPPAKLGAVRSLLAGLVEDELTVADHAAIQAGLDSLEAHGPVPMEVILADLGLTMSEFDRLSAESGRDG